MKIVAEEKSLIRECEEPVVTDKQKAINRAISAGRFIEFINSKTDQDL